MNYSTKQILRHLIKTFPARQEIDNFEVPDNEKQIFLNKLFEMEQRGLIKAAFRVSNLHKTYGQPIDVQGIIITNKGREFMIERKSTPQNITQNISIDNANGTLNIAGHNIDISNGADADDLIKKLIETVENSNLPPDKKKSLGESIKDMVANVSSSVLAGIITHAVSK